MFEPGQTVEWRNGPTLSSGAYLGPDKWSGWARVDTKDGERLVRTDNLRPEGVLAAEEAELADLIERAKGYPVGDDEHAASSRQHRFPWCDTCKRPSVARDDLGLVHSTTEHPFGVPPNEDDSGHDVTHAEWYRVPR